MKLTILFDKVENGAFYYTAKVEGNKGVERIGFKAFYVEDLKEYWLCFSRNEKCIVRYDRDFVNDIPSFAKKGIEREFNLRSV